MPVLRRGGQPHQPAAIPDDFLEDELVWVIPFTGEIFRVYEDYLERILNYNTRHWSCTLTGKSGLSYEEALESERKAAAKLSAKFPDTHVEPVIRAIHHLSLPIDQVIEKLYNWFRDEYVAGETVTYEKDDFSGDVEIIEVIGQTRNVFASAVNNGDDSDDEPLVKPSTSETSTNETSTNPAAETNDSKELSQTPLRYKIRLSDKTQTVVEAAELERDRLPLTKAILKNFIRDATKRETYPGAPYIAKDVYVSKFRLPKELPEDLLIVKLKYDRREARKRKAREIAEEKELEAKRQKEEEKERRRQERDQYPMEDTMLPVDHELPQERPVQSTDFGIDRDHVAEMLATWHFLHTFSKTVALSKFSLEDFENALIYDGTSADTSNPAAHRGYADMCPLLTATICALLRALLRDEEAVQVASARADDADVSYLSDLDDPNEDNWDSVLETYIERQDKERSAIMLPHVLQEKLYMHGNMTATAKLALVHYLCDEVAQTIAFRDALDDAFDEMKSLETMRKQERIEYRKLRKEEEKARKEEKENSKSSGSGSDNSSDSDSGSGEDENTDNGGRSTPNMAVDEDGRASRRAMLEYRQVMRAKEERRKQKEQEQQKKIQAAKNAEQRAEAVARKQRQEQRLEEERKEAKYQEAMFRLRAVRHEPLGLDRYHTAYWFFADTSQLFCQSNDDKWGHLANPDELEMLYSSLNLKGIRECHLSANLSRHYRAISTAMKRRQEELRRDEDSRRSARIQTKAKEGGFMNYVNLLAEN